MKIYQQYPNEYKEKDFKYYNLYNQIPEDEISYDDFQINCARRIQLLRYIEDQTQNSIQDDLLHQQIISKSKEFELLLGQGITPQDNLFYETNYRNDFISHFILRVAFSNSDENLHWFLKMETHLFKARIQSLVQDKLIQELNIKYEELDFQEFIKLKENIINGNEKNKESKQLSYKDFIKVSFLDSLMFLPNLQVFLNKGKAYFRRDNLMIIAVKYFKQNLLNKLRISQKQYKSILQQDQRIKDLIQQLPKMYLGNDYNKDQFVKNEGKLKLLNLDFVAKHQFPPCMRNLYDALIREHHLKHEGRLQLGLFLKGAGLSYDDSLHFWKKEFTKKISNDKFEKEYAYNIRHNYGKEGNRKNYQPRNCQKILLGTQPGNNEHHGCPFKVFNERNLTILLNKMGITNESNLNQILLKKRENHLQLACKKTFESLFPNILPEGVGQHPNAYLDNVFKLKDEK